MRNHPMRMPRNRTSRSGLAALAVAATVSFAGAALAAEQPIGKPIEKYGMSIAAVFIQSVKMDPAMPGAEPENTDIHLEADTWADGKNDNGFPPGNWIPYLAIDYTLKKTGSDWTTHGTLMPMVAADGPHYGANVKLDGPGEYALTFDIKPPSANGFLRHYDKETGVAAWWKPFTYTGSFVFAGTGKKGGY